MGGKKRYLVVLFLLFFLIKFSYSSSDFYSVTSGNTTLDVFNITGQVGQSTFFITRYFNTSSNESINGTNVSCWMDFNNETKNLTFDPVFGASNISVYKTSKTFLSPEVSSYNVTCNGTSIGYDLLNGTGWYDIYNANLTVEVVSLIGTLVAETMPSQFRANFTDLSRNPITGANCTLNLSNQIFSMNYSSSGYYFYNHTFNVSGTYNYTVNCNKTGYSSLKLNLNVTVVEYKPVFDLFQDFSGSEGIDECSNNLLDIDNNGKVDYFFTGDTGASRIVGSYEYKDNFTIANFDSGLPPVFRSSQAFSDLDNDGDTDLVRCGAFNSTENILSIYRNINNSFIDINISLVRIRFCSLSIFDYNNDGKSDILISGLNGTNGGSDSKVTQLYKNLGNINFQFNKTLYGLFYSTTSYADINNDKKVDILELGSFNTGALDINSLMYFSNDSYNTNYSIFKNLTQGSLVWFDFDNDNDMDLILSGTERLNTAANASLYYYENNGSGLIIKQILNGIFYGSITAGDLNNDGYGDFYVNGDDTSFNWESYLYIFNGTKFNIENNSLKKIDLSSSTSFDYDNDGDLDIGICGADLSGSYNSIYSNNISLIRPNNPPSPPNVSSINVTYDTNSGTLNVSWGPGSDDLTPTPGLYYHLRVGTAQNPDAIVSSVYSISSNPQQGYLGNMMQRRNIDLNVPDGNYLIQIQTIDSGLKRSNWSTIKQHNSTICTYSNGYDWNVTIDCEVYQDFIGISQDKKVYIENGGSLKLDNTILSLNSTITNVSIQVNNGTLILNNSNLNGLNQDFQIYVAKTSNIIIENTNITGLEKIKIDGNSTIVNSRISCDYCLEYNNQTSVIIQDSIITTNNTLLNLTDISSFLIINSILNITNSTDSYMTNSITKQYNSSQEINFTYSNSTYYIYYYMTLNLTDTSGNALNNANIVINNTWSALDNSTTVNDKEILNILTKRINDSLTIKNIPEINVTKKDYFPYDISLNLTGNYLLHIPLEFTHVPDFSEFENSITTNFTFYAYNRNLDNITNATIGKPNIGKIQFLSSINFTDLNITDIIKINEKNISVDVSKSQRLNTSARITFTNLTYTYKPILLKDGVLCNSSVCQNQNYNGTNFSFTVNSFSVYTLIGNSKAIVSYSPSECNVKGENTTINVQYVNATSGAEITNGNCSITVNGTSYTNQGYNFSVNFSNPNSGTIFMNVSCNATGFEYVTANDSYYARETNTTVGFSKMYLKSVDRSSVVFNDFNNDNYEELLLSGYDTQNSFYFYKNNAILALSNFNITEGLRWSSISTTDYDNDGVIDIIMSGLGTSSSKLIIYDNNGNSVYSFSDGFERSSSNTYDYDNDGDIDMLISGAISSTIPTTRIYENINDVFNSSSISLQDIKEGGALFFDYNNDGLKDIIVIGTNYSNNEKTSLYLNNDSGIFIEDNQPLTNLELSTVSVSDIDSDGDLDLFIAGRDIGSNKDSIIYTNTEGNFSYNASWSNNLIGLMRGKSVFFDYDNDGDLDLLYFGENSTNNYQTFLYENNGTTFVQNTNLSLAGIRYGSVAVSDYDNDGDLDFVLTGENNSGQPYSSLYTNDIAECINNQKPTAPAIINSTYSNNHLVVKWNSSNDDFTPSISMNYQLRIGNSTHNDSIVSGVVSKSSNPVDIGFGNTGLRTNLTLNIPDQCMHIQVKAIDNSLQESNWSSVYTYSTTEVCDHYDNDCDGVIDEGFDGDGDGYFPPSCTGYSVYDYCDSDSGTHGTCPSASQQASETVNTINTAPIVSPIIEEDTEDNQTNTTEDNNQTSEPLPEEPPKVGIMWSVLENNIRHGRDYYFEHGTTHIVEIFKNQNPFPLNNAVARIDMPKTVAASAKNITSFKTFSVIEEDPVITHSIGDIDTFKEYEFEYVVPGKVDPEGINTTIFVDEEEEIEEFEELVEQTKDVVDIKKKVTRDNQTNTTKYELEFDFKNESVLYNVTVYQEIPKCLINFIKREDIISDIDFEIVNEDPLIAWHFDKVIRGDRLEFAIRALAESGCDDEGETLAVAKSILILKKEVSYKNIAYSFGVIIFVLIVLVMFASITDRIRENKKDILLKAAHEHYRSGGKSAQLAIQLHDHGHDEKTIEHAVSLGAKNPLQHMLMRLEIGIEEAIILVIITLNFLETFKVLSGDAGFVKNIISWTVLSYLLYHTSVTRVLFGVRKKMVDFMLLASFFIMTLKNFTAVALSSIVDARFFRDIYTIAIRYNDIIEKNLFFYGMVAIVLISALISIRVRYQNPSVAGILTKKKKSFILTFSLLVFFFIAVYNLMFEWLAIAFDAPLAFILTVTSIFLIIKHHAKVRFSETLFNMGSLAEGFYERIIQLFQYRMMLPIAVSGLLILHVLSDIGNYLLPYATGLKNTLYSTSAQSTPLFTIFSSKPSVFATQTIGIHLSDKITLFWIYLSNIIFAIILFGLPGYVWYVMYKNRKKPVSLLRPIKISRPVILLIVFTGIVSLMVPVFSYSPEQAQDDSLILERFTGISLTTHRADTAPPMSFLTLVIGLLGVGAAHLLMLRNEMKRLVKNTILLGSAMFVLYYLSSFLVSTTISHLDSVREILAGGLNAKAFIMHFSFSVILAADIVFYAGGALLFIIELWRRREFPFEYLELKHLEHLTRHHDMYHVHYFGVHDEVNQGDAITYVKNYIKKSLKAGHGMVRIEEFLEEHDWPYEMIHEAKKRISNTEPQLLHKHSLNLHKKAALDRLNRWVESQLNRNTTIEIITEKALDHGWTEDDVEYVMENLKEVKQEVENEESA